MPEHLRDRMPQKADVLRGDVGGVRIGGDELHHFIEECLERRGVRQLRVARHEFGLHGWLTSSMNCTAVSAGCTRTNLGEEMGGKFVRAYPA